MKLTPLGPLIDNDIYIGYPPVLLKEGKYDQSIQIMEGHNTDEGLLFSSPFIHNNTEFESNIKQMFRDAPESTISTIRQELYPDDFTGTYGYTDQQGRIALVISDAAIVCNTYFIDKIYEPSKASFGYQFSVPPSWHGFDLKYTFMDPKSPEAGVNTTLAVIMQRYLTSFAATGSPNPVEGSSIPEFTIARGLVVQNLNNTLLGPMPDSSINVTRCDWWQKVLFIGGRYKHAAWLEYNTGIPTHLI